MDRPAHKHTEILSRGVALAKTGEFQTWEEIVVALVAEGYAAAPNALKGYRGAVLLYPWEKPNA